MVPIKEVIISNRFHSKWHRRNHHTYGHNGEVDTSHDPIASPQDPFSGEFVLAGALSAVAPLSAFAGYFYTNSNGSNAIIAKAAGPNSTGIYVSGASAGIFARSLTGDKGSIDIDQFGNTNVVFPNFGPGYLAVNAQGNLLVTDAISAASIWTDAMYATSAVLLVTDMHITELSGFTVKGTDYRKAVPTSINPATEQLVFLQGIGVSGTSWASFAGQLQCNALTVNGPTVLNGDLTLVGNDFSKNVPSVIGPGNEVLLLSGIGLSGSSWASIAGDVEVGQDLFVDRNTIMTGTLDVNGGLTARSGLKVVGSTIVEDLVVCGQSFHDDTEYFYGDVHIANPTSTLYVSGDISVKGGFSADSPVFSDLFVNGGLTAVGDSRFQSNLTVDNNLSAYGTATFVNPLYVNGVYFDGTTEQFAPITNSPGDAEVLQYNSGANNYTWVPNAGGGLPGGGFGGGASGGCTAVSATELYAGAGHQIDGFDNTKNDGAYWELVVYSDAGDKRTSRIFGVWEGSVFEYTETSSESIGQTSAINLYMFYNAGDIEIRADIDAGDPNMWTIEGLRCIHNDAGGGPGGLDTHVQYNNNFAFSGDAGFTYDNATSDVYIGGALYAGGSVAKAAGWLYGGTTNPSSNQRLNYNGYFYATRLYNAVYNDIADQQKMAPGVELHPGKCYYYTREGVDICKERCQMAVVGVASDTYGVCVGATVEHKAPIAVAGWVLAHVDEEYAPGTPLTNDENGDLTEMSLEEKRDYPERMVAIYQRKESEPFWGVPGSEIAVNGRHWVKVK